MFVASGIVLVLAGAVGLTSMFSWRPILPGVLAPLILMGAGAVLLLFSVAHYVVTRWCAQPMNRVLAVSTLLLIMVALGYYLGSARSMEAYLSSSRPGAASAESGVISRMMGAEMSAVLAILTFLINVTLTRRKRIHGQVSA